MTKPPRDPWQPALFAQPHRRLGRAEAALERTLRAARATGGLPPTSAALVAAARVLARQLDGCEREESAYVAATVVREYRATLTDLGLLGHAGAGDSLDEQLARLLAPVVDTTDTGRA